MVSEETPQGAPDRVLLIQVEPLLDETVQSLYVRPGQGHAERLLNHLVRQLNSSSSRVLVFPELYPDEAHA